MPPVRAAQVAAALIALAAAAGCSSSSSPAPAASSAPAAPASPASPASPAATSGSTSVPPPSAPSTSLAPAVAGPPPCATSALRVTLGTPSGYAGGVYQAIVFINTSAATCGLYGYPGVSLVSAPPYTQIGLAAQRGTNTPVKQITLAPGAIASAVLQVVDALNYPSATCNPTRAAFLRVYPPGQIAPVYLADASQVCAQPVQTLFISAVQAGPGAPA